MSKPRRVTVRLSELDRLARWASANDLKPLAADALPGGAVRLHFVPPLGPAGMDADALEKAEAAWDAALA